MRCYNLVIVLLPIVAHLWNIIKCQSESQSRDIKFRDKYCDRQYKAWDKMQEADNITLANICLKSFSFERESDEGTAEAHKHLNRTLVYGQYDDVTLDILQCKIRYRNVRQEITGEAVYYLAEGCDDSVAFKIYLVPITPSEPKFRIVLGGEVKNIWNLTIDPSVKLGSISAVDIDFYNKNS